MSPLSFIHLLLWPMLFGLLMEKMEHDCVYLSVFERNCGCEKWRRRVGKHRMCKIPLRVKKGAEEIWGYCFLMPNPGNHLFPYTWLWRGEHASSWSCGVFVTQGTPAIFGKEVYVGGIFLDNRCGIPFTIPPFSGLSLLTRNSFWSQTDIFLCLPF